MICCTHRGSYIEGGSGKVARSPRSPSTGFGQIDTFPTRSTWHGFVAKAISIVLELAKTVQACTSVCTLIVATRGPACSTPGVREAPHKVVLQRRKLHKHDGADVYIVSFDSVWYSKVESKIVPLIEAEQRPPSHR